MQVKRQTVFITLICAFILGACSLPGVASPTPDPLYIESIVQTRIASIPTNTPPPTITPAPTATVTPLSFIATPTVTLLYQIPTATGTPSLTDCPIIITPNETDAGQILHVRRCEDNLEYNIGPFSNGIYTVGPNLNFIIYVTDDGFLYAAKVGNPFMTLIANLKWDGVFAAINKRVQPKFTISFAGEAPRFKVILYEKRFGEKRVFDLPLSITK